MKKKIEIIEANLDFFDFFYDIKSEEDNIYWSGHEEKPKYNALKKWYQEQLENKNRIIFKIHSEAKSVGYLYFDLDHEKSLIEFSYAISNQYSDLGFGTASVREAITFSYKNFLNYRIIAFVAEENIGSHRIMQKNSFLKTNKHYLQFLKRPKKEVKMLEYTYNVNKVFIIAEAGVNHNGDIQLAKKLIDKASEAGVDAVKFQTWKTELLVTKEAKQAAYQVTNTKKEESQFSMLKRLELSYNEFGELKEYCDSKNILFLSTPDEVESANFLCTLQEIFKIGSGELTNKPFLKHIGSLKKQIILSTGMANLKEIEDAIKILIDSGTSKNKITILHANTQYPTPMKDVNLKAMLTIKEKLGINVGYSDHTLGIEIPIAAVALGAKIIEKHFTLDKSMNGPDHKASLDPNELRNMVKAIRNIEIGLGSMKKVPSESEIENIAIVRKSIVANASVKKGDLFTEKNITTMRPGTGVSPMQWDTMIGSKALKNYKKGDLI